MKNCMSILKDLLLDSWTYGFLLNFNFEVSSLHLNWTLFLKWSECLQIFHVMNRKIRSLILRGHHLHTGKSKKRGLFQTWFEDDENCKVMMMVMMIMIKMILRFLYGYFSKLDNHIQLQSDISYKPQNTCTPSESPE